MEGHDGGTGSRRISLLVSRIGIARRSPPVGPGDAVAEIALSLFRTFTPGPVVAHRMRRREAIFAGGTAAAVLAGCLSRAQEPPSDPEPDGPTRSIVVTESGEVRAEPDLAVIDVGVEATGDDAATVRDELADRAADLERALREAGIDEEAITTSRFAIRERVDRERMREAGGDPESRTDVEEFTYYHGTHAYRVEVRDVEAAGEVVDTAVEAGADDVGRVEFTLSEARREALRETALEAAISDANDEAAFVADQLDTSVLGVSTIDTAGGRVRPVRERVALASGDGGAAPTRFQPGDVTVTARVHVQYEMG